MSESDLEELRDRVRRLEDVAFDGDGLQRSVTRLGMNATALGDALLQVDRNQQALTKLGTELRTVQETTVPREEVESRIEDERRQRIHDIVRTAIIMGISILLATYIAVWMHELYRDQCSLPLNGQPPGWCQNIFPFDDERTVGDVSHH